MSNKYLGVIGGGQLGMFTCIAAKKKGLNTLVFSNSKDFSAKKINDKETIEIIKNFSKEYNFVIDPHTATAVGASKDIKDGSEILILGTAHPYKFLETIKMATSLEVETPKQIAHLMDKKENYDILENKINDVKSYILEKIS